MAKIVNVQLLVNSDDQAQIADGLNNALREVVHPMGSGGAEGSFILDYHFPDQLNLASVTAEIEQSIKALDYVESSAFAATSAKDHYLLQIAGDVDPIIHGPFANADELLEAARAVYAARDEDGLHRLAVPKGAEIEVEAFTDYELQQNTPAALVCEAFCRGETPIERITTGKHFTVLIEGEEVVINLELLDAIEAHMGEDLVVIQEEINEVMVPLSRARQHIDKQRWLDAVAAGETENSLGDYQYELTADLPRAREVLINNRSQD
jgi:uncharacterized protein YacL (UPF0231 family)